MKKFLKTITAISLIATFSLYSMRESIVYSTTEEDKWRTAYETILQDILSENVERNRNSMPPTSESQLLLQFKNDVDAYVDKKIKKQEKSPVSESTIYESETFGY